MNQELERFEPAEVTGRLAYEHFHRYAICREFADGRRVLDVACGAGYGTNFLAQAAAEATGIDIDPAVVCRAKRKYRRDNLKFLTADCYDLPFEAGSFDLIVANEIIEHIDDHDRFIDEAKRVLRPSGTLLVSTPNKPVYNRYKAPNPFHVSEMDVLEFQELLGDHFKHVQMIGLRMALVSAGFDLWPSGQVPNLSAAKTYRGSRTEKGRPEIGIDDLRLADPEYVLAICSDRPLERDAASSSIYFSCDDDLWAEHEKIMAWASQLHEEDEVLRADLRRARSDLEEAQSALEAQSPANFASADSEHLKVSARLLERIVGGQVKADPVSLIEAMFTLNEQVVRQRARLEAMSEVEAKAAQLARELEASRIEQDRLRSEARRAEIRVEELGRDVRRASEERERMATEIDKERTDKEKLSAEVERSLQEAQDVRAELEVRTSRLTAQLDDVNASFASERSDKERLAVELERLQCESARSEAEAAAEIYRLGGELERLQRESQKSEAEAVAKARRLDTELKRVQSAFDKLNAEKKRGLPIKDVPAVLAPVGMGISDPASARQRQQARLESSQRLVREQLDWSRGSVRAAIPAPSQERRSLLHRVTGRRPYQRSLPFDASWVEKQVPGAGRITISEFLRDSRYHRVDPHPLFSAAEYLDRHPDVAEAGLSPLEHYMNHGWREGRDPHPFFANDWYLQQNRDVLEAGINPLLHYLEHGWREGRRPNPVFDPAAYLSRYQDVQAAGLEPLTHFIAHGQRENRDVPYMGLEKDWRSLAGRTHARSLMEHLLSADVTVATPPPNVGPTDASPADDGRWPPHPLSDFWIPQALRDFLVEKQWQGIIPLTTFLYWVMDAYADRPDEFASSDVCRRLVDRVRTLANARDASAPDASVIIPVYNNILDTLLCIVALLETEPKVSFEILVADDCSTDATASIIPQIGGVVRHLRHPENMGFLGNCNAAAEQARGRTIVLLNNDALPFPGWLDGLLAPFERMERIGLVGSKLINWDGRLQEAGGIFWRDGSAWNFGRGQNPLDPEFNYLKDVDYISGASIAVPADLWRDLGGFDPAYAPAYCEDSDMAFRIRERGLRTVYNPQSEIIHHEGRSHGTDTGSGIKAYQVSNQERLSRRWRDELYRHHFANGENVLRARDRSFGKPHILVIDHYIPQPDKDAGSRTMFQFLEALIDSGWAVTFWPENLHHDAPYARLLQEIGVEVIYGVKFVGKFSDFLRDRADLYDAVLLSRPHVAIHFVDDVRALTKARVLYYGHDIHFERMKAQRMIAGSTIEEEAVEVMRATELSLCDKCDVVLYPSEEEATLLRKLVAKTVLARAIPAYRFHEDALAKAEDAASRIEAIEGRTARLLFVGGFSHGPNVDGIAWFCREVAPILRDNGFPFDLNIVGSNPTSEVWDLEGQGAHVLGFVSDERLAELYRESDIVIAPLRFGAGVKGKVVEAMAQGVPVATTSVGAQGLAQPEDYLFLGDTAEEFAASIRAATDAGAAREKAGAAVEFVRRNYSQEAMIEIFRQVLPSTASIRQAA